MPTMRKRLGEFYRRLAALPRAASAAEALEQICRTLDQVEDDLSGIPRASPPPVRGQAMAECIRLWMTMSPSMGMVELQQPPEATESKSKLMAKWRSSTARAVRRSSRHESAHSGRD